MLLQNAHLRLAREGDVFRLTLCDADHDNTFSHAALDAWQEALDVVAGAPGNAALLIDSSSPKTFCNGINLAWAPAQPLAELERFIVRLDDLFLRIATLNLPTLAAINGNCYAGGAILAAACDFRLMRADRGRFCYSEVKLRVPFTTAMLEVVRLLSGTEAMFELSVTADAWGGEQCARRGVVHEALPIEQLAARALERATALATKDRGTYTAIKRGIRDRVNAIAVSRGLSEPPKLGLPAGLLGGMGPG